jgi:glycosyltransferase involved in cell wall biosynthesis
MEKNKKLIIVDSFSINNFHETFNSAFLLALTLSSKKNITYYASNGAIAAIKNLVKAHRLMDKLDGVSFSSIKIFEGNNSLGILLRYIKGFFINFNKLFLSSKGDTLIFTILNPFFIWPLQIFLLLFKRNVYVICHGELELPIKESKVYKPSFIYKILISSFLSFGKFNKQFKMLLLGDNIKQYLLSLYPNLNNNQLLTIDHPVIFRNTENKQLTNIKSNKLTVGTVGAISIEKGFDKLVALSQKIDKHRVNINVVGSYHFNIGSFKNIHFVSKEGLQLPTNIYLEEINKLDFVLFLFDKESYKLTVSGAVFDAIKLNKPIIAIKNNYFDAIFDLFGPIGYLCDNIEEMYNIIHSMTENKDYIENFTMFRKNIDKLKAHYSYRNVGLELNKLKL